MGIKRNYLKRILKGRVKKQTKNQWIWILDIMLDTRKCMWILVIGLWVRAGGRKRHNDTYEMIFATTLMYVCA